MRTPATHAAAAAMLRIRPLDAGDLPAIAALLLRVHAGHGWAAESDCQRYLRQVLLEHPWPDPALPSWVAEHAGRVCGLYAVMPRRMRLRRRELRVAVGCQFVVDPEHRHGLTALRLAQACLAGPQDLTLVDGANDSARRLFAAFGFCAPWVFNLHWTRPLRPARWALSLRAGRDAGTGGVARALAVPLAPLLDSLALRLRANRFLCGQGGPRETALTAADVAAKLDEVGGGRALRPVYDTGSLQWLLDRAAQLAPRGLLRGRAVWDCAGPLLGWYLHFVREGGRCEVVQMAAREGAQAAVLRAQLADAWRAGCTAAHGRFDPAFADALACHQGWLRAEGPWTAFHTRDAEVAAALTRGDAWLSRLDGEWWLGFHGR